ncbi:MAG: tRNA lysidine(34) synthetase TilS, partial [Candidatus Kapabacteria bacterium]|nr:tRNA lysidine(34) synthetase TilS [Candidatus Kapabacteria bacterium]
IEEAARDLRYKFFERVVSTEKVEYLATAHTADDSVETFLINLFRGSGLTGLSGIPARRNFIKNIFVIRPLINFKKSDLIKYAKLRELRWREDSSNSESIYTRNKIRNTLIPFLEKEYNPNLVNILNRTSRLIQQADKYVVERVKENIDSVVFSSTENSINLKLPLLQTHNAFIQGEILQLLFEKHFSNTALTNSQIDSIIDLLNANTGTRINIYQNIFALKDRETIVIFKEKVVEKINKKIKTIGEYEFENFKLILSEINKNDIELDDNPLIEYLDYEFMPQFLNIRNWQKGDSFVPFGMNGRVKLSDYFINEKVSTLQKDNICVLDDGLDIIWVIGKRFSEKYKISKDTKKFLKAEVQFK